MVGQISERARSYIRRRATANMLAQCRIERVTGPSLDEDTLSAMSGARETIYEGQCRIWEVNGGPAVQVSEDEFALQNTTLSIPWDVAPVPRRDDEVRILSAPADTSLVGRRYRIMDSAKAGDLRPTRRFSLQGMQENQQWQS